MSEQLSTSYAGPSLAELRAWLGGLSYPSVETGDAAVLIDRIAVMEQLKSALAAAQARDTVRFKELQLAEQRAAGVSGSALGKGISAQVALARRESANKGGRLVGLAEALVNELPNTLGAMSVGELSEWRATIVAQETACLSVEHRAEVDARLASRLARLSDWQLRSETRKHTYELDPHAFLDRSRKAEADRRVTMRPAPDTMTLLTGLLPCVAGVSVYAALVAAADAGRAAGDPRSRGQIMADTLVERVTGRAAADGASVEVQVVMTDRTLFAGDDTPARLTGYGPLPAPYMRDLIRNLPDETKVWMRRLYVDPTTGQLTGMESSRREFAGNLRRQVVIRDEVCRTPWCGAPIRHLDHPVPVEEGGETSETNGQGLCEACNYAKQGLGWRSRPSPSGAGETVQITTPTGHTYSSHAPPLPGALPDAPVEYRRLPRMTIYYFPAVDDGEAA